jgi:hypothetical protein
MKIQAIKSCTTWELLRLAVRICDKNTSNQIMHYLGAVATGCQLPVPMREIQASCPDWLLQHPFGPASEAMAPPNAKVHHELRQNTNMCWILSSK